MGGAGAHRRCLECAGPTPRQASSFGFAGGAGQWGAFAQLAHEPDNKQTADGLHSEFLQFCRESGIEDIAKHSGIVQNGELSDLKTYSAASARTLFLHPFRVGQLGLDGR
jgi:hypothetical protein